MPIGRPSRAQHGLERIKGTRPPGMLAWRASGVRPSVVCVHGAGVSSRELLPFVAAAQGTRETWAVDLPGFGGSAGPARPSLTELATALAEWIDAHELSPAHLLGCSFGCQVVLELAMRFPHQVRSSVLVGPTIDTTARTVPRQLARLVRNSFHEPPAMFPLTLLDYRDAGARRTMTAFAEAIRDRIDHKLPSLTVPAWVVRGDRDALAPQAWVEEVTRLLPRGRLVVWPRSAHMVPYKFPEGLAELTERFHLEVDS